MARMRGTTDAAMPGALVVERDADLRATLEEVPGCEGYRSMGVEDAATARDLLRASARPLVVLVSEGGPGLASDGVALLEDAGRLPRHAYLLLSTRPAAAPVVVNPHTRRVVPVVAEPFELDELLDAIGEAAACLMQPVLVEA